MRFIKPFKRHIHTSGIILVIHPIASPLLSVYFIPPFLHDSFVKSLFFMVNSHLNPIIPIKSIPFLHHFWHIWHASSMIQSLPSGKRLHNYGESQFLMGKSTISIAIFNSYVSLPEGKPYLLWVKSLKQTQIYPASPRNGTSAGDVLQKSQVRSWSDFRLLDWV